MKIDHIDRHILYELDRDSGQPLSKIGEKTGLSNQVVNYRCKKLERYGIIKKYMTVIDFSKIGYSLHKSCFRLKNLTSEKREHIIDYLNSHERVFWIASSEGRFDLSAAFLGKNMFEISEFLCEFDERYAENISERSLVNILQGEYLLRNHLVEKKSRIYREPPYFGSLKNDSGIDYKNFIILKELANNSRAKYSQISKKASISDDNVRYRIKKMQESGIIQDHIALLDAKKMGLIHNKLNISLRNRSDRMQKSLLSHLRHHPNTIFINRTLGDWDIEVDLETTDSFQFREILMNINNRFSNVIKEYSIVNIYEVNKYDFLPMRSL